METLMIAAFVMPLITAVIVQLTGSNENLRDGLTVVCASITFGLVASLAPGVMDGGRPAVEFIELFPGVSLAFELEPLGLIYALVASGLWIPTSIYAFGYMRGHHEINQTRFFTCFALAIFAALGIAFSANLLTLFLFYEVMTFSTWPLVTHHQDAEAKTGGRVYLGILVSTSVLFLLLGVIWTYQATGTVDFTPGGVMAGKVDGGLAAILLALFAFGTGKAALFPFHRWLPNAMVAPTPVSALLHAVAVVKAGVFTVLKVVVYIFGIDFLTSTGANEWLVYVAAFTLIFSSVVALTLDNLKARLAYSTISQLAYIVLAAATATTAGVMGGGLHIVFHAVGKITLFFCAGAIYVVAHKKYVSQLDGIGRQMPWTMTAFLVGAMSICGLPTAVGMWSKGFLMQGGVETGFGWVEWVYALSTVLAIGYLFPIVGRAFFMKPKSDGHHDHPVSEAAHPMVVWPLVFTAALCLALWFFGSPILELLYGMDLTGAVAAGGPNG